MRCFVGIPVAPGPTAVLGAVPCPSGGRPVRAADLHLTLAFLGERDRRWSEALWPALGALAAATPAFTVALTAADLFPGPHGRVWAAWAEPSEALRDLHRGVWECLSEAGVSDEARDFLPHVTLARLPHPTPARPVPGPWSLPVEALLFYHSPAQEDGYRALKRWPLRQP